MQQAEDAASSKVASVSRVSVYFPTVLKDIAILDGSDHLLRIA